MSVEELTVPSTAMDYGTYEQDALRLVQYDDDRRLTIGGVAIEERMHIGIFEEWSEIFGGDHESTVCTFGYSRIDELCGGTAYTDQFRDDPQGEKQIKLHTHEFGDNLWYVTNYLALFGISLSETMRDVDVSFEHSGDYEDAMLERAEYLRCYPVELAGFVECGRGLFSHMGAIFNRKTPSMSLDEEAERTLKHLSRRYVESMAILVDATFGLQLEDVMTANLRKIADRWENDTVLGSGDAR